MGWASGFRAGTDMANSWIDTYQRSAIQRGIKKIDEDYETVQGRGLKVTDAQGNTSDAVIDPAAGADYDAIRQQYEQAGYKVDYADAPQYAARSGEGRDVGVYDTEAGAESASRKQNYGLARQRADVYEQYGNPEMARGLRRDAQQLRMEDQKMDMAQEQLGLAKNADKRAAEAHTSQQAMSEIQLRAAKRDDEYAAARQGGLTSVMKWYDSINDGIRAVLTRGPKGELIARRFDEDTGQEIEPMPLGANETEAMARLDAMMTKGGALQLAQFESDREYKRGSLDLQKQGLDDTRAYHAASLKNDRARLAQGNRPQWMPVVGADGRITYYDARGAQQPAPVQGQKVLTDLDKIRLAGYNKALAGIDTNDPVAVQQLQDAFQVGHLMNSGAQLPPPLPPRGQGAPAPAGRGLPRAPAAPAAPLARATDVQQGASEIDELSAALGAGDMTLVPDGKGGYTYARRPQGAGLRFDPRNAR